MKKVIITLIIIIAAIGVYFIVKENKTIKDTSKTDNSKSIEQEENTNQDSRGLLLDVMNNKQKFIKQNNDEVFLKEFKIVQNQIAEPQKYAFVDFDGDGTEELVIYTTSDYGAYIILHYEENKVYGYMVEVRSLENLKADGSFMGSNGAKSTEYLKMSFDKNDYIVKTEAIYDEENEIYRINNKDVSLEEITKYDKEWKKKEAVEWTNY